MECDPHHRVQSQNTVSGLSLTTFFRDLSGDFPDFLCQIWESVGRYLSAGISKDRHFFDKCFPRLALKKCNHPVHLLLRESFFVELGVRSFESLPAKFICDDFLNFCFELGHLLFEGFFLLGIEFRAFKSRLYQRIGDLVDLAERHFELRLGIREAQKGLYRLR